MTLVNGFDKKTKVYNNYKLH